MLFRRSAESESRILTAVGMGVIGCAAVVVTAAAVGDSIGARPASQLGIVIEAPYVGQGVEAGTPLILHGVKVGEVTHVASLRDGGVQLAADLQRGPTTGLSDTMGIDFRPANYFGVTGINLQAREGGQPLAEGSLIKSTPSGNFTMQALLSRLGEVSHGVVTPKLIDVIERATNYIDSLNPLLETMLTVSNSLASVQTVSTARLLTNATGISVAFPGFVNAATHLGDSYARGADLGTASQDFFQHTVMDSWDLVSGSFFGAIGKLESSHSTDLAPMTDLIKVMTDVVPGVVPPDAIADTARELRLRLERMFAGPPDRRAVNVRVILDNLPGIAAPIDAVGGAPR